MSAKRAVHSAVAELALESGEAGVKYHAAAEEGVQMRAIAEAIGSRLGGAGEISDPR
jgi:hypothetical protein